MSKVPLLKAIVMGSGGVGKSALTLRFMYDEVSNLCKTIDMQLCSIDALTHINMHKSFHLDRIQALSYKQFHYRSIKGFSRRARCSLRRMI